MVSLTEEFLPLQLSQLELVGKHGSSLVVDAMPIWCVVAHCWPVSRGGMLGARVSSREARDGRSGDPPCPFIGARGTVRMTHLG